MGTCRLLLPPGACGFDVIPSEARDLLLSSARQYFVYVLASRSRVPYTGVTNQLERRISEHRSGLVPGFTHRYRIDRLVYCESFGDIRAAIAREKQIKSWRREKRVALIERDNPTWADLAEPTLGAQHKKSRSLAPAEPGLGMTS